MKQRLVLLVFLLLSFTQVKIESVSADAFARALETYGTSQLIDVRTPAEYAAGHIPGARLVNLYDASFREKVMTGLQKEKPVLVYCRSGHRSLVAARFLASQGFRVINLKYGFRDWKSHGKPTEK